MNDPHKFKPESLMMSYGFKPELSEGSIKSPIFQTSTFVFKSAEEGKVFFEIAYGIREKGLTEEVGLIYSRINNPDLEILETRLKLWDEADDSAVFESGMAAISTVLLEFLSPGDVLLYSTPVYGGTDHFINHFLQKIGILTIAFKPNHTKEDILNLLKASGKTDKLAMIYIETPANPTNALIDIEMCAEISKELSTLDKKVYVAVDNTYMGPLWSQPLKHGADFSIYSATKYIGGHSDLIAGAVSGNKEVISRTKILRTFLGNMAAPHTGWLLMRSLETLKIRMEQQAINAKEVAIFLKNHPKVEKVYYLGFIPENTEEFNVFKRQYSCAGAMLSFDIVGGEKEAFKFMNALKLIKLAVSLGGTESLVEHPATMTHVGVDPSCKHELFITEKLIRISVGVENHADIIWDIEQALINI